MFRITSSVIASRRLLYCRVLPDIPVATFNSDPTKCMPKKLQREACPVPPVPPPPPKDDSLFWGAMTLLCLAGGFIFYAKSNPELRDWLTINASWIDDIIAIAYQENMTYKEFAQQCAEDLNRAMVNFFKDDGTRQCSIDGKLLPIEEPPEEVPECSKKEIEGDYVVVNLNDQDSEFDDDEDEEECPPPPTIMTKNICEIEQCLKELSNDALHNYMTARDACICYNKSVEETSVNFSVPALKKLRGEMEERIALVKESVERGGCSAAKLKELQRYFDCGVQASKEAVKNTQDMLKEFLQKIEMTKMEFQWENDKSIAKDAQWQKVEALIDKYTEENMTMSKGLDYTSNKPFLRGDPDLLLHHTLRYMDMLKSQLSEALCGMKERVNRAMETLSPCEKKVKEREANLQAIYKKRLAELHAEFKKRANDLKAHNDKNLKDSLKKQQEKSRETLAIRLKEKEIEATKKLDKLVAAQVATERKQMKNEIKNMSTKLKLVEDKLNARLKAERETRRSQELWSAGASLLAATQKGEPYVRVDKELKAIEKASGDGDKLVLSVLKAIPQSVREKGVVPESVLREKYQVMEDVAMKVALVEQEGAPLPVYFLSYVQSIFLFMKISGIPQQEFDKPPKEVSKDLDTFDLLQRARFWMERGNIAAALKYITALEGASRAAAASWHDAARSYLETRQAAEAVLAHAAALGLQYL